jgi:hypothetical protein
MLSKRKQECWQWELLKTSRQRLPSTSARFHPVASLRCPVERGDLAVRVHREDRVRDGLEDEVRVAGVEVFEHTHKMKHLIEECNTVSHFFSHLKHSD